jgi:flagellar biosynthesis/type III secretory pathway protein FliH
MHPRDLALIRELMRDDELRLRTLQVQLVADESLQFGGCIVEAPSGDYDGGLENQLRRLHAILTAQDAARPLVAVRARAAEA